MLLFQFTQVSLQPIEPSDEIISHGGGLEFCSLHIHHLTSSHVWTMKIVAPCLLPNILINLPCPSWLLLTCVHVKPKCSNLVCPHVVDSLSCGAHGTMPFYKWHKPPNPHNAYKSTSCIKITSPKLEHTLEKIRVPSHCPTHFHLTLSYYHSFAFP